MRSGRSGASDKHPNICALLMRALPVTLTVPWARRCCGVQTTAAEPPQARQHLFRQSYRRAAAASNTPLGTRDEPLVGPDTPAAIDSPSIMILAVSTSQAPWKTSEAALPALQHTQQQASKAVRQRASHHKA